MNGRENDVSAVLVELYWWRSRNVESKERDKKLIADNEGSQNSSAAKLAEVTETNPLPGLG